MSIELNALLQQEYKKDNYIIEETGSNNRRCIIFFSGNGLYYPNEGEVFHQVIQVNDRYEWRKIASASEIRKEFSKIILLRNIYKNWYINGINERLNNIDKLTEWLRSETNGYEIITVGNSAGGYAALLIGNLIGAKAIFSFSGQNNLWNHRAMEEYWVKEGKDIFQVCRYYDATKYMKSMIPVFYFVPNESEEDVMQAKNYEGYSNVYQFDFCSSNHGTTLVNANYKYILTKTIEELIALSRHYEGKKINSIEFFSHTGGLEGKKYFVWFFLNMIYRYLVKIWKRIKG